MSLVGGARICILTRSSKDSYVPTIYTDMSSLCEKHVSLFYWCVGFMHRPMFFEICPFCASLKHIFILATLTPFLTEMLIQVIQRAIKWLPAYYSEGKIIFSRGFKANISTDFIFSRMTELDSMILTPVRG